MGGIGDAIGGLLGGIFGGGGNAAQEEAMRRQAEAAEKAAKMQEQQAAAAAARQQQATNKANADIADAATATEKSPTVTNSSNLTGSMGVPSLNTAGGAMLGSSLLEEEDLDEEFKK